MKYNSDVNEWLDQFTPFMQYISGNSPKPVGGTSRVTYFSLTFFTGFASPQLRPQPFDISLKNHLEGEELKSTSTIELDEEIPEEEESPSRMVELEIAEPKQPTIEGIFPPFYRIFLFTFFPRRRPIIRLLRS